MLFEGDKSQFLFEGDKSQFLFTLKIFILVYMSMVETPLLWECHLTYLNCWEWGFLCDQNPHHLGMVWKEKFPVQRRHMKAYGRERKASAEKRKGKGGNHI